MRGRFAPSPTGAMHLGNARTALLAWLACRSAGGRMVLRLEDLDRERVIRDAEQRLCDELGWLGLDWDEGPDVGGLHGPYRQSERVHLYASYANELIASAHATRRRRVDLAFVRPREERPASHVQTRSPVRRRIFHCP